MLSEKLSHFFTICFPGRSQKGAKIAGGSQRGLVGSKWGGGGDPKEPKVSWARELSITTKDYCWTQWHSLQGPNDDNCAVCKAPKTTVALFATASSGLQLFSLSFLCTFGVSTIPMSVPRNRVGKNLPIGEARIGSMRSILNQTWSRIGLKYLPK